MRALIDNIGGHSIDSFKKSVDILVEESKSEQSYN